MWLVGSRNLANVEVTSLDGDKGVGFHRLTMNLRFSVPAHQVTTAGEQKARIQDVTGEVSVQGRRGSGYVGRLLPRGEPLLIQTSTYHQDNVPKSFAIEMDRQRLNAIEDIRQGRDLTFTISLYAVATLPTGVEVVRMEITKTVNQGTWVETLTKLGYANVMLLEIPIQDSDGMPEMAAATSHLSMAQQAMARGEYREAVGLCRDCLESLSVALGDKDDQDTTFQPMFTKSRELDKTARVRLVRRAAKVLTHPARHADEVASRIDWERIDAQTIVSIVAALVQLGARP